MSHYENFPVASIFCPPRLRPAIAAIYAFARTADDLADVGDATAGQRLADLAVFRDDLLAIAANEPCSSRWPEVFGPLAEVLLDKKLPIALLLDLLSAFEQDVTQHVYHDRAQLIDYCRRSASPIGRLLLHLYGIDAAPALQQSDAICTALQLTNFWQDLRIDSARGRVYLPAADRARFGLPDDALLMQRDTPALRSLLAEMIVWTRALIHAGEPLVHAIPGRAGWELRLVVQGGLRILEKIEGLDYASMLVRPTVRKVEWPLLLWRALRMGRTSLLLHDGTPA